MKIFLKTLAIIAISIFLVAGTIGDEKPKKGELKSALKMTLPGFVQLYDFDVEILENMGNKVDPKWASRFKAIIKSNVPLYVFDKREKKKKITFVILKNKKNSKTEMYGKIFSVLYQGKWKHEFVVDGDPNSDFGLPLEQFTDERVIVRGSKEEEIYKTKVNRIQDERLNRFVAHANGTVTDIKTGLMWAAKTNGRDIGWEVARSYCQDYTGGGYDDWRLPTKKELASLYDNPEANSRYGFANKLIDNSKKGLWASDTRGKGAGRFAKVSAQGRHYWATARGMGTRALPVRNAK